ncbi:MAG TPA: DNA polymerase III subunit delta' [Rhodocyclaceae bacterium]|nr:DNA polymerase III subunit delta' [Rhodocyclaceae bacterium]
MSVNTYYQWHEAQWKALWQRPETLHHALLLAGPAGVGKGRFAEALAARFLCESPKGDQACGVCEACHWFATGNHPDFRKIGLESDEPEEEEGAKPAKSAKAAKKTAPSTQIKIEQVRGLEDFIYVGSHRQGRRVVIIEPAEAMNVAAANALLKVLEEPPPNVHFLMVSSKWRSLLPTLISRCRRITFGVPETAAAVAWLQEQGVKDAEQNLRLAGGSPLTALQQAEKGRGDGAASFIASLAAGVADPIAAAAQWDSLIRAQADFSNEALVDTLQKWLHDLTRVANGSTPRFLTAQQAALTRIAGACNPERLLRFNRELLKIRATARHPLNPQLFLEDLAARYALATAASRAQR